MTEEEHRKSDLIRAARAFMQYVNARSICVHMPDSDDVLLAGDPDELPELLKRHQQDPL
ncbi:hypothetical protein [Pseudoduganella chitinolytica]|uniref:Uncharacterized protein n=1 Tax=Pseudoduganella chitinolytica TaxID=34070 RepID=A0ABY8BG42_9BURK|nr:hypothetical protein [Pseudoduganella chitinolytica]WEF34906.1 hypothetical protein PX653_09140 [Pseudoduganella chitinolytica]